MSYDYINTIQQMKEEISIREVFLKYLPGISFKKGGLAKYRANCFHHNEKDASMFLFENTNSWWCYGCNIGGSNIDLVMLVLNLDFTEAVKQLADDFGYKLPERTPEAEEKRKLEETRTELLNKYVVQSQANLESNSEAIEAIRRRGLDDESTKEFGFGFEPKKKPDSPEEARSLGLIGNSGGYLPSGRIIIPFTSYGKPVYLAFWDFNGREPKYLYPSGEGNVFAKLKVYQF